MPASVDHASPHESDNARRMAGGVCGSEAITVRLVAGHPTGATPCQRTNSTPAKFRFPRRSTRNDPCSNADSGTTASASVTRSLFT